MVFNRSVQVRIRCLQRRFDLLEQNYTDISEQLNYESNAQNRNNLKRQLAHLEKEMTIAEDELNTLERGNVGDKTQRLMAILASVDLPTTQRIKAAYLASCPSGWSDFRPAIPPTIEQLLADLEDIAILFRSWQFSKLKPLLYLGFKPFTCYILFRIAICLLGIVGTSEWISLWHI
jgi:hypothetical protein